MSVLTSIDIKGLVGKYDQFSYGCDYLRLSFLNSSEYIQSKIDLLDIDNSNFGIDEIAGIEFTFQKIPTPLGVGLTYSCSFNDVSVPCFQFVKFNSDTRNITGRYGKLDFYGSMFRLVEIGFFDNSLFLEIKNTISSENPKITRYDFKIDLFSKNSKVVPDVGDVVELHSQSQYQAMYEGNNLTNWLVGTKTNGRYAIRFYDKLLDTDTKNKFFLYQDYYLFKSVHRLEFELQRNFLKGFTFFDFFDGSLFEYIEKVLGFEGEYLDSVFYKYDQSYKIQEKDRVKYLKRFDTMSIRLAKNGINPLVQCFMSLYEGLDDIEFDNNVFEFITYLDKAKNKMKYYDMRKELLDKFTN